MADDTPVQQTNQPVTGEPNVPPPHTPPVNQPPPPAANTPNAADIIGGLQQSIDGLSESVIGGMKEAFPFLTQPPAAAQEQQVDDTAKNAATNTDTAAKVTDKKDTRSRLARAWFG